jgi:hypothetical protein
MAWGWASMPPGMSLQIASVTLYSSRVMLPWLQVSCHGFHSSKVILGALDELLYSDKRHTCLAIIGKNVVFRKMTIIGTITSFFAKNHYSFFVKNEAKRFLSEWIKIPILPLN